MTILANVFAISGFTTIPTGDKPLHAVKYPLLGRYSFRSGIATGEVSPASIATPNTVALWVQVAPGKRIHYELMPSSRETVDATEASPVLEGDAVIQFGPGWRISIREAL